MKKFNKIGIEELQFLANHLLNYRRDVESLIAEFGEVSSTNGVGTTFLTPYDPIFKTFWIYQKDGRVESVGFGGPNWNLKLLDLHSVYKLHTEGFNRYDDAYVYVFFESNESMYSIQIFSKEKLFKGEEILDNTSINGVELFFR